MASLLSGVTRLKRACKIHFEPHRRDVYSISVAMCIAEFATVLRETLDKLV